MLQKCEEQHTRASNSALDSIALTILSCSVELEIKLIVDE